MDCSSTSQILPLRLISMTGIWRRQVTDIVVIVHFLLFFLFLSPPSSSTLNLSPPPPHPHSPPPTPDHIPSQTRSPFPSCPCPAFRPTLSMPLSTHLPHS